MTAELNLQGISELKRSISLIEEYDQIEREHKQNALDWLGSGKNPYRIKKPDIPPKHLVAYCVLVDPNHSCLLLVDHIKAQLWLPTGGHVLFNENPKTTVMREIKEELNLEATFLKGSESPLFITQTRTVGLTPGHTDVSLWYALRGNKHAYINFNRSEFTDIEWYSFSDILQSDPAIFDPHLKRFTKKLQASL